MKHLHEIVIRNNILELQQHFVNLEIYPKLTKYSELNRNDIRLHIDKTYIFEKFNIFNLFGLNAVIHNIDLGVANDTYKRDLILRINLHTEYSKDIVIEFFKINNYDR
jgi:hypothetical protein